MPIPLITSNPDFKKPTPVDSTALTVPHLNVAEFFADTVTGENTFNPATFLRLQGCTLNCVWCDTTEVWRYGNPYTFDELLDLMAPHVEKYRAGQRLVLTGGSPLKQQVNLIPFIQAVIRRFGFKPYIEIENEAVLKPDPGLTPYIDQWNNSPKLRNSQMPEKARYKPEILKFTAELPNSWFKFVVSAESDWEEIEKDFLKPGIVRRDQIVLMPEGQTRLELQAHYQDVVNICVRESIRFTDRLHITIWDKKTGV